MGNSVGNENGQTLAEVIIGIMVGLALGGLLLWTLGCTIYLAPDELQMQKSVDSRLGNLEGRVGRIEQQIDVPVVLQTPVPEFRIDPEINWSLDTQRWPEAKP